jgi:hypothetical protein
MNDDFFRTLETTRTRAIVERDLAAIERLHAPEYELVTPTGRVFSLASYLAAIASEPFYADWEHRDIRVRASDNMAVVRYQAKLTFPSGKVVECWHTDTYELRDSIWLAVWSQATRLPESGPTVNPQAGPP